MTRPTKTIIIIIAVAAVVVGGLAWREVMQAYTAQVAAYMATL